MGTQLAGTTHPKGDPLLPCKHYLTFQGYPEPCMRRVDSPQLAYGTESTARILKETKVAETNGEQLTDILAPGNCVLVHMFWTG